MSGEVTPSNMHKLVDKAVNAIIRKLPVKERVGVDGDASVVS